MGDSERWTVTDPVQVGVRLKTKRPSCIPSGDDHHDGGFACIGVLGQFPYLTGHVHGEVLQAFMCVSDSQTLLRPVRG